jgi:SAM-dependent methyltransferase
MLHITAQQRRRIAYLSALVCGLPTTFSIRLPLEPDNITPDSEAQRDDSTGRESTLEFDVVGDGDGTNFTGYPLEIECDKRMAQLTEVTTDAACPAIEPRMEPFQVKDTLHWLHFKCDRYLPIRRCYEAIPYGVGVNPLLMPSASSDWRTFARLFWPSQALLDWHGMANHVPGTFGNVDASHGWEWLAKRTGNCYNCWSTPSYLERQKAEVDRYLRTELAAVPFADLRLMLDLGGGAGNIAAALNRDYNITMVTDNLDFGAPFLETIAARGLLSLSFSMFRRLPFADGVFDAVHSRTTGMGNDVEAFLVENDRLVRPGGYIILHSQCAGNPQNLQKLRRTAARLRLEDSNTFKVNVSPNARCHTVSVIYRKPDVRSLPLAVTQGLATDRASHCESLDCLCKHRLEAWKLQGQTVGTCSDEAEALWHWISQHCLDLGVNAVRIPRPSRCAAATKKPPPVAAPGAQHGTLFTALTQLGLPLRTDALRTMLDVEGNGALVSQLQATYGTQGMVVSSDLRKLKAIASRRVVALQSPLSMRQPFETGAFDMIHVPATFLEKALRAQSRNRSETHQESFRLSANGDLSAPSPVPGLSVLVYEMDRLVRPGGFVVISLSLQAPSVPGILHGVVGKLGWERRAWEEMQGVVYARPSTRTRRRTDGARGGGLE